MKHFILTISLLSCLCGIEIFAQVGGFKFSSWNEFDLQGGYPAGDIVVIKNGYPQSPVLTRDRLLKSLDDQTILDYKTQNVPPHKFDRKKIFKSSVEAKASTFSGEVKGSLNKVKSVTLNVEKGSRAYLKSGSDIAIIDLIKALKEEDLETVQTALSLNKRVCFITEVLMYEKADLTFDFGLALSAEAKIKLEEIVDFSGKVSETENGKLIIKYGKVDESEYAYVGYKAIDLKKHKALIEAELRKKKSNQSYQ